MNSSICASTSNAASPLPCLTTHLSHPPLLTTDGDDDSADGQSEGGSDEHSSSGDEIKLTGALRRGDEEYDSEQEPEEDDEEEDEEGEDQPTIVSVSLDFCDPHERFFHGIRYATTSFVRVYCTAQAPQLAT